MKTISLGSVVGVALIGACGVGAVSGIVWGVQYDARGAAYCRTQHAIAQSDCTYAWNNGGQTLADKHIALGEREARYWIVNGSTIGQDEGWQRYTVFQQDRAAD